MEQLQTRKNNFTYGIWGEAVAQRPSTMVNVPNLLTLIRIILTPLFVILLQKNYFNMALSVFVVAGITDALDGFIARQFNQRTKLGAQLDPLADKLLLLSSYISLAILEIIPQWLMTIVITRDVLIMLGIATLTIAHKPYTIKPSIISKCTTVFQLITVFFTLLHPDLLNFILIQTCLFWITAGFTIVSGLHYIYIGIYQLRNN